MSLEQRYVLGVRLPRRVEQIAQCRNRADNVSTANVATILSQREWRRIGAGRLQNDVAGITAVIRSPMPGISPTIGSSPIFQPVPGIAIELSSSFATTRTRFALASGASPSMPSCVPDSLLLVDSGHLAIPRLE